MKLRRLLLASAAAIGLAAIGIGAPNVVSAQQAAAVAIDNDDIGGVVRGAGRAGGRRLGDRGNPRSAGALHQDRRHRRSGPLRDPRSAEGQLRRLGARLRPCRLAEGEERARQAAQSHRGAGARTTAEAATVLSGDLLVRDDEDPGGRAVRQQGRAAERQADRLSQRHEEQRLRRLPSARPAIDPHHPRVPPRRRRRTTKKPGCAASSPGRPARTWSTIAAGQLGGVPFKYLADWTERVPEGRVAVRQADAAARRRAQHRRHAARLAQRQAISARPDRQRPPLSDGQRLRAGVRAVRARLRRHADPRSGEERRDEFRAADHARHAAGARARQRRLGQDPGAFGLLGRGEHLEQQGQQPQLDVRPEGPPLARRDRPRAGQPGVLQEGLEPSVGRRVSARPHQPPGDDVRSQDRQIHRLPDLLRLASSAVRLRRQRDAVDVHRRRRRQCRLDQHQDARRDRRHREVAGLDRAGARHQRQRPARRIHRARPADGAGQGHAASARRSTP